MTQQFNGVQILRFVAAMLVAVMHVTQAISIHITGMGESHYWAPGTAGVDIFFVISGFVMAMSTRGLPSGGPARKRAAWIFMKRRILRIVPLYWFYTLLKAALILAVPALAIKSSIVPAHMAASLLFVPMTAPWGLVQPVLPVGWTLNFEMLFYTVFAIAIALGAPRIRFCLLVFLSLFLAGQAWRGAVPLVFYAQSIIFEFVLGVGVAQVLIRSAQGRHPGLDSAWGALLMLAGFVFMFAFGWRTDGERLVPWGIGAAIVVMGAVWFEDWIKRMPGVRPLSFLGDASYSIYLSHPFVVPAAVVLLKRMGLADTTLVALLACAAVVVAGALSHVLIEKPMISFFKRFLFPAAPRAASTAPTAPTATHAGNSPAK
jgi:exopolysaccharide production protein ExoZ